jgi:hypothetical protein
MGMVQAGPSATVDAFIGYYKPYATSHEDLDTDPEVFTLVTNAALSLASMVAQLRSGTYTPPDEGVQSPRQK